MKNIKNLTIVLFVAAFFAVSCGDSSSSKSDKKETSERKTEKSETNEKSDKIGSETKIGDQVWMTQNLDVDKFRNGDPIPEAKTVEAWEEAGKNKQPAWCYLENNPENGKKFGKLYNWYAVTDDRGLAPDGWRIPSKDDWEKLVETLGQGAHEKMKRKSDWDYDTGNLNNESGFTALTGLYRKPNGDIKEPTDEWEEFGIWWSNTEFVDNRANFFRISILSHEINHLKKGFGMSVRCIKE